MELSYATQLSNTLGSVIDFCDLTAQSIIQCPDAWGRFEAPEVQIELLAEVRRIALGQEPDAARELVRGRFRSFRARYCPNLSNLTLARLCEMRIRDLRIPFGTHSLNPEVERLVIVELSKQLGLLWKELIA